MLVLQLNDGIHDNAFNLIAPIHNETNIVGPNPVWLSSYTKNEPDGEPLPPCLEPTRRARIVNKDPSLPFPDSIRLLYPQQDGVQRGIWELALVCVDQEGANNFEGKRLFVGGRCSRENPSIPNLRADIPFRVAITIHDIHIANCTTPDPDAFIQLEHICRSNPAIVDLHLADNN